MIKELEKMSMSKVDKDPRNLDYSIIILLKAIKKDPKEKAIIYIFKI